MLAFLVLMRSAISRSSERFGSCSAGSHARSVEGGVQDTQRQNYGSSVASEACTGPGDAD